MSFGLVQVHRGCQALRKVLLNCFRSPFKALRPIPYFADELKTSLLPQEVLDHIIDFNHADPKTLRELALVSHSFLHSARCHIFHTIIVSLADRSTNNYASFAQLLKGGGAPISRAVRALRLIGGQIDHSKITVPMLVALVGELPRLCELHLFSLSISSGSPPYAFPSRLPIGLQILHFYDCHIHSQTWRPVLEIISLFDSILTLNLIELYTDSSMPVPASNLSLLETDPDLETYFKGDRKRRVRSLTIQDEDVQAFPALVGGLMNLLDVAQLGMLCIKYDLQRREPNALLIQTASLALNNLVLFAQKIHWHDAEGLPDDANEDQDPNNEIRNTVAVDISSCEMLQSILFQFGFDNDGTQVQPDFHALDTLTTLPRPSSLSSVVFAFAYYDSIPLTKDTHELNASLMVLAQRPEWRRLTSLLRVKRFPALRKLMFMVRQELDCNWTLPGATEELFRTSLSELGDHCSLHFQSNWGELSQ